MWVCECVSVSLSLALCLFFISFALGSEICIKLLAKVKSSRKIIIIFYFLFFFSLSLLVAFLIGLQLTFRGVWQGSHAPSLLP